MPTPTGRIQDNYYIACTGIRERICPINGPIVRKLARKICTGANIIVVGQSSLAWSKPTPAATFVHPNLTIYIYDRIQKSRLKDWQGTSHRKKNTSELWIS